VRTERERDSEEVAAVMVVVRDLTVKKGSNITFGSEGSQAVPLVIVVMYA
jgi:hypothetical protein